ncbi:unnamed protein product [Timema podura]|uniref:SH3 domain-containing protein n=1 Tax=Timema podura TaxID=61482 RepID=A0ABN7NVF7_TIMPD|nr:unnamed protein product [Timema podura]
MIHKEKIARREIGVLTANKTTSRQYKIIAPANPEKPIKYVRKPVDFTALDDLGHGVKATTGGTPRTKQRGSSQGSIQSLGSVSTTAAMMVGPMVGPAPTTKPPTPPQAVRTGGTLSKGSREYRTPPAVAPPQKIGHTDVTCIVYTPNPSALGPCHSIRVYSGDGPLSSGFLVIMLPIIHWATQDARAEVLATVPYPCHLQLTCILHTLPHSHAAHPSPPMSPPQVGMVHPIPHNIQAPPPPPPPSSYGDHHSSMPPPPSPLASTMTGGGDMMHHAHTLPHHHYQHHRTGNVSPPLPPPPPPDDEHSQFGRPQQGRMMAIVPDEEDLPGWVPKNYIEKVVAIYDYYADKEDELSFQESSVIYVLKKNDDGWWEGVMDGITGLFPGNYVEPCV